jgi:membrane-bound inhibitor of C-type lysozyme
MNEQQFATKYHKDIIKKLRELEVQAAAIEYKICSYRTFNFNKFQPSQRAVFSSIFSDKDVYHKIEDAGMGSRFVDAIYLTPEITKPILAIWYKKEKQAKIYLLKKEDMERGKITINEGIKI